MSSGSSDGAPPAGRASPAPFDLVVLAASAGGLKALSAVLGALPADFPAAVVAVQHLDPRHRSLIDDILRRRINLGVRLAAEGDRVEPGTVLIAPPDHHVLINPDRTISLSQSALVHFVRPSADLLFESAAGSYREKVIGVILTGSGSDGSMGVKAVKENGGTVIAQDEATSQFFGMPGAAMETGAVDFSLPIEDIGPALVGLLAGGDKGL